MWIIEEILSTVSNRARTGYWALIAGTADPKDRLRFTLALAELQDPEVPGRLKTELGALSVALVKELSEYALRPAVDILRQADPHWLSDWVTERVMGGALWLDSWPSLILGIPTQLQDERDILAHIIASLDSPEALRAGLSLIDDQSPQALPFALRRAIEDLFLEKRPYKEGSQSYTLVPRTASDIKLRLFEMSKKDPRRSHTASMLLAEIETWRLEYGRPADEPRHPLVASGEDWPPAEPTTQVDMSGPSQQPQTSVSKSDPKRPDSVRTGDPSKKTTAAKPKEPAFRTAFGEYTKTGRILGEGATGRVFEVTDEDGQKLAIKCLLPGSVTGERSKRFRNEIEFCARNKHANLITARDWGLTEITGKEVPFYVMPLYSSTLRKLLKDGIDPARAIPLFRQLLEGIESAHGQGVWHRDLKPENILYDPAADRIVISDFGIAHFAEPLLRTLIETVSGDRLANFQYAAPEQRARKPVGPPADIYALGLILNEMFTGELLSGTGHKPIASGNPAYAFLDAIVDRMARQTPEDRPSLGEIKQAVGVTAPPSTITTEPVPVPIPVAPATPSTLAQIEVLQKSGARIRIAPIIPVRCAQDEFRVSNVTPDIVEFDKGQHRIVIPRARILEILPEDTEHRRVVILLNGRLQWISVTQSWKFMPEIPPEGELPIGLGKMSAAQDQRRITIENMYKTRGRPVQLIDINEFGNAFAQDWQVVYDEDGKYFNVRNGQNHLILITHGP